MARHRPPRLRVAFRDRKSYNPGRMSKPVPSKRFNGVKVFSATMQPDRDRLGDKITDWIAAHPTFEVTEIVVTQSSDASFHCVAFSVFYWETIAPRSR
jgi:hypothetical protein